MFVMWGLGVMGYQIVTTHRRGLRDGGGEAVDEAVE